MRRVGMCFRPSSSSSPWHCPFVPPPDGEADRGTGMNVQGFNQEGKTIGSMFVL